MKKRILALILGLVLSAASLAGCTGADTPSGPVNTRDKDDSTNENTGDTVSDDNNDTAGNDISETDPVADAAEASGNEGEGTGEDNNTEPETDDGELYVLQNDGSSKIFLVDHKGNKKGEYDILDFADEIPHVSNPAWVYAIDYYDGVIVLYTSYYEGSEWKKVILGYDTAIDRVIDIYSLAEDEYFDSADVYDGKLYIITNDYKSAEGTARYMEKEFTRSAYKGFDYVDSPATDILSGMNGYYLRLNRDDTSGSYSSECITRSLKEYGYIVATKEKSLYLFMEDGSSREVQNPFDAYPAVEGYDADSILYRVYGDNNQSYYYLYTLNNDLSFIEADLANAYPLDYSDGKLYFYRELSAEYGRSDYCVYRFDTKEKTLETIYDIWKVPGVSYSPAVQGFRLIDGQIYFVDVMDRCLKWVRVNYDESGASYTDIYCVDKEINKLKYGDVKYRSNSFNCPYCGTVLYEEYLEAFQILPELSDKYEDINASLMDDISGESNMLEGVTEDACEDHLESPALYDETVNRTVSDVRRIGDKYLTIDMDSYWYTGGAHGMPGRDHYLIDLETGKFLELRDFYKGTEEDFVNLMLDIVERDYNNGEDYINYMYSTEYDDIVSGIKNSTGFGLVGISFYEDGVNVEYPPYMIGPYASGFIEIKVTYEELLGRNSL